MWLIDNVKIKWSLSKQELLFSDFCEDTDNIEEGAEYNKLFLDYTAETYSKFMQGEDSFEDEEELFLSKLKKLYNVDEALLSSMEEKQRILSEEMERLEKESHTDRLMTKRMERMKLQTDLKQLQSYRSSLDSFKANLENKVSELTNELENTVSHLESLKHERDALQVQLQNQKFTPADCGEDQQREEGTPADHHQPQQVSGRCRTAQVERGDRSGQSQGEGGAEAV
ncbi:hypothetical protein fugu_003917 [Takifugu bimaculatus]|uniref:DUF5595 domain-containing protein n=1 Tax=Takifugu bimaculatus TaxID=433685 RepID=A0A4Z2BBF6_9TELE|nr:hypothetical protein fugu_003917 [Takifugu bimaculatus]